MVLCGANTDTSTLTGPARADGGVSRPARPRRRRTRAIARLEVAAGDGALRTLVTPSLWVIAEVVDERAVALDGLGPHARPGADDVGRTDVGT